MRTVTVVGARPQFVKLAPVSREMKRSSERFGESIEDIIVHTGQHYDADMSGNFFEELEIPEPNANLAIGSGSHGAQTGRMLAALETFFMERSPDVVVVYGDTNSTLAGALAAAKLHIPTAHVEAGLRSFDRRMPEEVNRIVSDHLAELLLAPTQTAVTNLRDENLGERTRFVGDVMYDAVLHNRTLANRSAKVLERLALSEDEFALVTIHRASNTERAPLRTILDSLNEIAAMELPVVFPVHPRTRASIEAACADWTPAERLKLIEPVGYLDMLSLLDAARFVMTDSGGVQKEAYFVRTPCVTLRDTTEWPETLAVGANVLVDVDARAIAAAALKASGARTRNGDARWSGELFGDGDAAGKIVSELLRLGSG